MDGIYAWSDRPDCHLDRTDIMNGTLWSATVKAITPGNVRPVQICFQDGNTKWVYPNMLTIVTKPLSIDSEQTNASGNVVVMAVKSWKKWMFRGK